MKKQYVSPEAKPVELADEIFTDVDVGNISGDGPLGD